MFIALSPSILTTTVLRFPSVIEKQGISKRFLGYFNSLDSTLGQKALGPDQTISGKVQSSVSGGVSQARAFNEEKGVTKKVADVRTLPPHCPFLCGTDDCHAVLYARVEYVLWQTGADVLHQIHEAHPRHPRGGKEACGVAQDQRC